jgi:hypothetical protein
MARSPASTVRPNAGTKSSGRVGACGIICAGRLPYPSDDFVPRLCALEAGGGIPFEDQVVAFKPGAICGSSTGHTGFDGLLIEQLDDGE